MLGTSKQPALIFQSHMLSEGEGELHVTVGNLCHSIMNCTWQNVVLFMLLLYIIVLQFATSWLICNLQFATSVMQMSIVLCKFSIQMVNSWNSV